MLPFVFHFQLADDKGVINAGITKEGRLTLPVEFSPLFHTSQVSGSRNSCTEIHEPISPCKLNFYLSTFDLWNV